MALPVDYDTVTVRGKYVYLDGTPVAGSVTFTGKVTAVSAATDTIIIPSSRTAQLDTYGAFTIDLPATDDPHVLPGGWTYKVEERFTGGGGRKFELDVPVASKDTGIDLSDVAPTGPSQPGDPTVFVTLTALSTAEFNADQIASGTLAEERLPDLTGIYSTPGSAQKVAQLVDVVKRGKGGVVGTNGRPVVSFRFDHQVDPFRSTVWPLHTARGIPASLGIVTGSMENPSAAYEPTTTTWAQLAAMVNEGCEIWAHSASHNDPSAAGTTIEDEIVGCKAALEARGFRVMGWQQPGGPATYGGFTTIEDMDSPEGRLIKDTYGLYEAYLLGTNRRSIPTDGCRGFDHVTLDDLTYTIAKGNVDQAIKYGLGIQFMLHSAVLGTAGKMTVADYTSLLDYVKTKWDAGEIEVLTATGLAFADPGSTRRLDLITDGGFEGLSTAVKGFGWTENSANSWTIGTDGGHTGSNYLRVLAAGTRAIQAGMPIVNLGLDGHAFIVDAWCRATETGGATARVRLRKGAGGTDLLLQKDFVLAQSTSWTHIRVPFVIPVGWSVLALEFGRGAGGSVDWDDVHAYAV